jgi:hypothetical protein
MEAVFSRMVQRFDAAQEYVSEGSVSSVSWLKTNCRLSGGAAAERVGMARQLSQLDQTSEAFGRGDISYHHVALMTHTADRVDAEAVRRAQPILLAAARKLDPGTFSLVTRRLRHTVDPDGALADLKHAHEQRYLMVSSTLDSVFILDGRLGAEGGAMLQTVLNALSKPLPDDQRSAAQRRADALIELCRRQVDSGSLPEVLGQRPHLNVKVTAAELAGVPGAGPGELAWGGLIPAETVRRIACDAALSVIVVDENNQPLDAGRTTRTVPAALTRALALRDGGCRFPGCDRPVDWTDRHHLQHWTKDGPTNLKNLVHLCRVHHRMVHEGCWQLICSDDGTYRAIPPPELIQRRIEAAARSA